MADHATTLYTPGPDTEVTSPITDSRENATRLPPNTVSSGQSPSHDDSQFNNSHTQNEVENRFNENNRSIPATAEENRFKTESGEDNRVERNNLFKKEDGEDNQFKPESRDNNRSTAETGEINQFKTETGEENRLKTTVTETGNRSCPPTHDENSKGDMTSREENRYEVTTRCNTENGSADNRFIAENRCDKPEVLRVEGHEVDLTVLDTTVPGEYSPTRTEDSARDKRGLPHKRYSRDSVMGYLINSSDDSDDDDTRVNNDVRENLTWSVAKAKEDIVRKDVKRYFKAVFDEHGGGEIPLSTLRNELNKARTTHLLSHNCIAHRLNAHDDSDVSYHQLLSLVTEDLKKERKRALRVMLLQGVFTVGVTRREKQTGVLARYRCLPPPVVVPLLTLVQLVIFIVYAAQEGSATSALGGYPSHSPLLWVASKRWQAWRFLTYMLLHSGILHIVFNIVGQLVVGVSMEMVHGWWRIALVYLSGVFTGSLAHSVVDPSVVLVGGSGGLYALIGVQLAALITHWKEVNYSACRREEFADHRCCSLARVLTSARARLTILILFVITDFSLAIARRAGVEESSKVGLTAHIAGLLIGVFVGVHLMRTLKKSKLSRRVSWVALAVFLLFYVIVVVINVFYVDLYPPTEWS